MATWQEEVRAAVPTMRPHGAEIAGRVARQRLAREIAAILGVAYVWDPRTENILKDVATLAEMDANTLLAVAREAEAADFAEAEEAAENMNEA